MRGYVVAIDEDDVIWLAWAAGMATGSGNADAARSIGGMLTRLQPFDTADGEEPTFDLEAPVDNVVELPTEEPETEQERVPDPDFTPIMHAPPTTPQTDFGAGPPPGPVTPNA